MAAFWYNKDGSTADPLIALILWSLTVLLRITAGFHLAGMLLTLESRMMKPNVDLSITEWFALLGSFLAAVRLFDESDLDYISELRCKLKDMDQKTQMPFSVLARRLSLCYQALQFISAVLLTTALGVFVIGFVPQYTPDDIVAPPRRARQLLRYVQVASTIHFSLKLLSLLVLTILAVFRNRPDWVHCEPSFDLWEQLRQQHQQRREDTRGLTNRSDESFEGDGFQDFE
eukprot:m.63025 g.63025  ORF g.63025 m.63025 type:complete len:230 (-) comp13947_c0_seq2:1353-2042(-)